MKPIYSQDPKAPRMKKGKYSSHVINKEMWKEFRERYSEYSHMSDAELREVWADIAKVIREESIKNPLGVKLGSYCGELKYQYLPYKYKAKDNALSAEVGEVTNHLNILTRGKVGKIKWERRWASRFNRFLVFYGFEPTREMTRLSKEHTDNNPDDIRVSRTTLGGSTVWAEKKS